MSSQIRHVTRTVVTRKAGDIDPKVAGVWSVAGFTLALVVGTVVVLAGLHVDIDWTAVVGTLVPLAVAAIVGWARRSSHNALVEEEIRDGVNDAATLIHAVAPAAVRLDPAAAPAIQQVEDGVEALDTALGTPRS